MKMKKGKIIVIFSTTLLFFSCESKIEKQKRQERAAHDSIEAEAKRVIDSTALASKIAAKKAAIAKADSIAKSNAPLKPSFGLDATFTSFESVHYDKNEVAWKTKEKNEFRFVYKPNLDKIIVYKNGRDFKTYEHPLFAFDEYSTNDLDNLTINGKVIFKMRFHFSQKYPNGSEAYIGEFAPNGFENNSPYYNLLEWRHRDPL
jgi:hypothetical protein